MSESLISLHSALGQAVFKDLPDIEYIDRNWIKWREQSKEDQAKAAQNPKDYPDLWIAKKRRPQDRDIEVVMFPQTWGSTALGYGGIGGSAMTMAYTVIVSMRGIYCVYFGGGAMAYKVEHSSKNFQQFLDDMRNQTMADVMKAAERYK